MFKIWDLQINNQTVGQERQKIKQYLKSTRSIWLNEREEEDKYNGLKHYIR